MGRSTAATPIMVHGSWRLSYTGVTAVAAEPVDVGNRVFLRLDQRAGCSSAIMLPIARYW